MKKILLVLVSLFAEAELAWAAVTPIADTPFNSNFSVKNAGSSGSAGSAGTSDDEDTSHTSTYEGDNLPACGPVTISAEGGEAAAKNLCATALGVDTDKVSYTLCDDGSRPVDAAVMIRPICIFSVTVLIRKRHARPALTAKRH